MRDDAIESDDAIERDASRRRNRVLSHALIEQPLGERGIRLSGGERQRIGIARALYRRPEVLILDEATSALDRNTEEEVMKAIHQLAGEKTIIMIAHRETTLRECDVSYRIVRGELEVVGSYAALVSEEPGRFERSDHERAS